MTIEYCVDKPFPTYEEIKQKLKESLPKTPIDPPGFEFKGLKFPGKPSNPFPTRESLQAEVENLAQSIKRYQNFSLMNAIIEVLNAVAGFSAVIPDIPGLPGINIITLLSGDPDELLQRIKDLVPTFPEPEPEVIPLDDETPTPTQSATPTPTPTSSEQVKDFLKQQAEETIATTEESVVSEIENRILDLFPFLPIPTPIYDTMRDPDFDIMSNLEYVLDNYQEILITNAVDWVNEVADILEIGSSFSLALPFPTPEELKAQFMEAVKSQREQAEQRIIKLGIELESIAQDVEDFQLPTFTIPQSMDDVSDPEFDVDQFIKKELGKLQTASIEDIVGFITDTLGLPVPLDLVCISFEIPNIEQEVENLLASSLDDSLRSIVG